MTDETYPEPAPDSIVRAQLTVLDDYSRALDTTGAQPSPFAGGMVAGIRLALAAASGSYRILGPDWLDGLRERVALPERESAAVIARRDAASREAAAAALTPTQTLVDVAADVDARYLPAVLDSGERYCRCNGFDAAVMAPAWCGCGHHASCHDPATPGSGCLHTLADCRRCAEREAPVAAIVPEFDDVAPEPDPADRPAASEDEPATITDHRYSGWLHWQGEQAGAPCGRCGRPAGEHVYPLMPTV